MSRKEENNSFICAHCGKPVTALTNGSYRNHCPHCLYSLHVDTIPGDRKNYCRGKMKPVDLLQNSKKGYQIVHQCERCGVKKVNRVAQDTEQPDDLDRIIQLMNGRNHL